MWVSNYSIKRINSKILKDGIKSIMQSRITKAIVAGKK